MYFILSEPFDSRLQTWCPFSSKYFSVHFQKTNGTILHNYVIMKKTRKFAMTKPYYQTCNLTQFLLMSSVGQKRHFYGPGPNLGSYIEFSYHVLLVSFNLNSSLLLLCLFVTLIFLMSMSLNLSLHDAASWLDLGHAFLAGMPEKWCCTLPSAPYEKLGAADWFPLLMRSLG